MFLFWVFLPYLIAAFVKVARKTSVFEHQSAMKVGQDVTEIAKQILKEREP